MHSNRSADILFRGIPSNQNRRSARFLTSLCIHLGAAGLVLAVAPQMVIPERTARITATLFAPAPEPPPPPPPEPPRPVVHVQKTPPPPPALRPLPRVVQARVVTPKLEEAPRLQNLPRIAPVLPAPPVEIRPAIQTNVFGASAPPQEVPKQPVVPQDAGFDRAAANTHNAQPTTVASAGFDSHPADARPDARPSQVNRGGFDVVPETQKSGTPDSVRKAGFDQAKVAAALAKRITPAVSPVRPIQILDKPKPVYTAEARSQKIEGDVLLDVVFSATGEVHVLGVVRGLGHGLDENAVDAARHIRFTPAMQSGIPVDQHVTLHVVFQITG